jgi:hypothetical protein
MPRSTMAEKPQQAGSALSAGILPSAAIAAGIVVLHLATNARYGFHRDELQLLSDARHMDWGFVAYPPLAPLLARMASSVFGLWLDGLRIVPVLAQAVAVVLTALMARDLGGGRLAQTTAALTVALSPVPLFEGTKFQYTSLDYLWWVVAAYFIVRLLKTDDPRWWLAIGATVGMGLETKYSIVFFVAGILAGMALSPARRFFANVWFWGGAAVAIVLFLPNLLWQAHHGFISYRFLEFIHARDVRMGRADGFLPEQVLNCVNVVATPLWLAGLIGSLRSPRFRMLGWMYLVPLALFLLAQARSYYLAPAYPMLLAMGSVAGERWVSGVKAAPTEARGREKKAKPPQQKPRAGRLAAAAVFLAGVVAWGAWTCAFLIPLQASAGKLRTFALVRNEDLRDEFGWDELVRTVAGIRDSLPAEEQAHLGIVVGNYGEQGAIEILGQAYHLPPPISTTNSAWLRGYPSPPPATLIVVGFRQDEAAEIFTGCKIAGHNGNAEGIRNVESQQNPDIFVCGPPREPWADFWANHQYFD